MIRCATAEDVPRIVQIHLQAFPAFFLSVLGRRFLRQLYLGVVEDETGVALIHEMDGIVHGFVAGSLMSARLYGRLIRKRWLRFAAAAAGAVLTRPWIAVRLIRALRKPAAEEAAIPAALLMSVAVLPQAQGTGIGAQLIKAFCCECVRHGVTKVRLTTDAVANEAANAFYRRLGFSVIRSFTTPEGREMNEYFQDLANSQS